MEIIRKKVFYSEKNLIKPLDSSLCFFDIETTGLNRKKNIIYLIGILYFNEEDNFWELIQFFANSLESEALLLEEASRFLSSFDTIVNYNGNSFDIPFLNYRLDLHNLDLKIDVERSLDIYSLLRKDRDFLNLENLKSVRCFLKYTL